MSNERTGEPAGTGAEVGAAKVVVVAAATLAAVTIGQPVLEAMQGRLEDFEHTEAPGERSDAIHEGALFEDALVSGQSLDLTALPYGYKVFKTKP
jgi:hypothetical protein